MKHLLDALFFEFSWAHIMLRPYFVRLIDALKILPQRKLVAKHCNFARASLTERLLESNVQKLPEIPFFDKVHVPMIFILTERVTD
ncbi:MAG: hypothetical protein EOP04_09725 [Proteobacteria bacterium]|nr:MAG: hypothetical protein EOP04_09725 [Pseudomonadota bacterium]